MLFRSSIFALSLALSGCSLFNVKPTVINQDARAVATYNLSIVDMCDIEPRNYITVDQDFNTTTRNLFFYINDIQGASGLIKDFGTSKSAKIESLPSAFILLGGTAPSQAGCDENYVFFFANLLLYAFTAR